MRALQRGVALGLAGGVLGAGPPVVRGRLLVERLGPQLGDLRQVLLDLGPRAGALVAVRGPRAQLVDRRPVLGGAGALLLGGAAGGQGRAVPGAGVGSGVAPAVPPAVALGLLGRQRLGDVLELGALGLDPVRERSRRPPATGRRC
jgi:hypothetical protein